MRVCFEHLPLHSCAFAKFVGKIKRVQLPLNFVACCVSSPPVDIVLVQSLVVCSVSTVVNLKEFSFGWRKRLCCTTPHYEIHFQFDCLHGLFYECMAINMYEFLEQNSYIFMH